MLRTKSILAPLHKSDGLRISVMSRHTLNDGTTPDGRLEGRYDERWPELSPPAQLIRSYYKRRLSSDSFEREFVQYLGSLDS